MCAILESIWLIIVIIELCVIIMITGTMYRGEYQTRTLKHSHSKNRMALTLSPIGVYPVESNCLILTKIYLNDHFVVSLIFIL